MVGLGAEPSRAAVAVNTVDVERFAGLAAAGRRDAVSVRSRFHAAEKNVLYVGSLIPRKGANELLEAFALLEGPERAVLHVVGSGPQQGELEGLARGVGAGKRVEFHGFLQEEDVARLAGVCDAFVCPSHRELWGLVINEALACGVPVLASRACGATGDLIAEGHNGFVIDSHDPSDIAQRLQVVMDDDGRARQMGAAALRSVRERASLQMSAAGFVQGIQSALS
jgi:glycosyltransferase involved in cell wall biosynthesis